MLGAVNYDVLEYPVLHSGELVGHILVVTPSQPFQEWKKAKDCGFLLPNHEVENILSIRRLRIYWRIPRWLPMR